MLEIVDRAAGQDRRIPLFLHLAIRASLFVLLFNQKPLPRAPLHLDESKTPA